MKTNNINLRNLEPEFVDIVEQEKLSKKIKTSTAAVLSILSKYPQQVIKIEKQQQQIHNLTAELATLRQHLSNIDNLILYVKNNT